MHSISRAYLLVASLYPLITSPQLLYPHILTTTILPCYVLLLYNFTSSLASNRSCRQCMLCGQSCPNSLWPFLDCSLLGSSIHGIFQARGVGRHILLQGIFLTQKSNPHHMHWQVSLSLSHLGSPYEGRCSTKLFIDWLEDSFST